MFCSVVLRRVSFVLCVLIVVLCCVRVWCANDDRVLCVLCVFCVCYVCVVCVCCGC